MICIRGNCTKRTIPLVGTDFCSAACEMEFNMMIANVDRHFKTHPDSSQIIWHMWSTTVAKTLKDITVHTPISNEMGFANERDAVVYAVSWGRIDRRIKK